MSECWMCGNVNEFGDPSCAYERQKRKEKSSTRVAPLMVQADLEHPRKDTGGEIVEDITRREIAAAFREGQISMRDRASIEAYKSFTSGSGEMKMASAAASNNIRAIEIIEWTGKALR